VEALAVWYLLVVAAVAAILAALARRRGHASGRVLLAFVVEGVGLIVLGFGLLALLLNGYVEDYGSAPARTLDIAVPLLSVGGVVMAAGGFLALRRPAGG
jgi:hypothetical protein